MKVKRMGVRERKAVEMVEFLDAQSGKVVLP